MRQIALLAAAILSLAAAASAEGALPAGALEELRRIGCLAPGEEAAGLRLRTATRCGQKAVGAEQNGVMTQDLVTAMRRLRPGAGSGNNGIVTPQAPVDAAGSTIAAIPIAPGVLPPALPEAELERNMRFGRDAWRKLTGFSEPSQPDRLVVRDFMPVPLIDGTALISGFGLRVRPVSGPPQGPKTPLLEIVDIQEFGPAWALQGGANIKVGGYIFGDLFSLDQTLRTAMSKSAAKKLRDGFSVQLVTATPYRNHKNEPRVQRVVMRLRVDPMVRPRGVWTVAQASEVQTETDRRRGLDEYIAAFRDRLEREPCLVGNGELYDIERELALLQKAAGPGAPDPNIRRERNVACAIAKDGPYEMADLIRLAAFREAGCADLAGGVSPAIRARAEEMRRQVPKPEYFDFARIGIYDLRDPSRTRLGRTEGLARKQCMLDYLEAEFFADR